LLGGSHLGYLGEVADAARAGFDLRGPCSAAELELGVLEARAVLVPSYRTLPPFPAVARDLSLVVAQTLAWSELARVVREAGGSALEAVDYLDTFQGGTVPPGKQSLHFGLRFRHPERTLTGEEVEEAIGAIITTCAARFEATLRA
jgi:phenylalanyl-tRNA synthetase beta chain